MNGAGRAICAVGCLACCADSLRPSEIAGPIALLHPALLGRILMLFHELCLRGAHVLSTGRLNLFSGSNELDQPFCGELRDLLSAFLLEHYGFPLGYTSSDIAFHISGSPNFRNNLRSMMTRPKTWDNICFSIDEQIPMSRRQDYERHLENLAWVWKAISPALECRLPHAKAFREREPRVILNFLIPANDDSFRPEFSTLFPGGPSRATSFKALIDRYVRPFVGNLEVTNLQVPDKHYFTSAVGRLAGLPSSMVYVAESRYALTGRGGDFIVGERGDSSPRFSVVRTKIVPTGRFKFRLQARLTTTPVSEDELRTSEELEPRWFGQINRRVIDVSEIDVWQPRSF